MPTYEVTSPDGKTYEVMAPEGASQNDVMGYVQQHHASAQPPAPGPQPSLLDKAVASPVGRFIQSNVVQPMESVANTVSNAGPFQTARAALTGGSLLLGQGLGVPHKQAAETAAQVGSNPVAALGNAENSAYESSLAANRNTQGYAEQRAIADKVMQARGNSGFTDQMTSGFNPSIAGLSGLLSSGGSLDASNAMADAQQQGQNTYQQAHPLMSMGANALGSLLMMPERGPLPAMPPKPSVPSVADLKSSAGQLYDKVDQAGHIISAPSYDTMVGDLQSKLASEGIDKTLHPNAMAAYDRVAAEQGNNVSFKGLDTLRKVAGDAISGAAANPADRRMGYIVQNHIDDFVDGLKPGDLVPGTGDPAQAVSDLSQARNLWSRASQAELIQKQIDKAGIKASANYSQSGMENALRQQFKSLALNDKAMARLSPEVRQAVLDVAKGSPVGNVLRAVGKYAPHGPVATAAGMGMGAMLGGVTGAAEGGMASMAVPMLGEAARTGATAMTQSAAQRAMDIAALGRLPQSGGAAFQLPALTSRSRVPLLLPLMLPRQAQSQRAGE